jgi:hypothetical protein
LLWHQYGALIFVTLTIGKVPLPASEALSLSGSHQPGRAVNLRRR